MRNKFAGTCYLCNKTVEAGKGHFECKNGKWWSIHEECVLKQRIEKVTT